MSIKVISNENGVTMVELVITLALVIIFSSIVTLSLSSSDKQSLEEAASTLQNDLRYVQRMAVVEGRRYQLIFNATNDGYRVFRLGLTEFDPNEVIKRVSFPDGVTLGSTNASQRTISYTPTGTTGDSCTIALKKDKYQLDLTITIGSGRIDKKKISKKNQFNN